MIDLHSALRTLATRRPVFHSEADFQHALAWTLHESSPHATLRLERPVTTPKGVLHVDLVAYLPQGVLVCELKYKTRALQYSLGGEQYNLQSHAAQPIGRYDFLMDIARLEGACRALSATSCWAILLTNDTVYWTEAGAASGISAAFSLAPGRHCSGLLEWGPNTSQGTKRARDAPITLAGQYCFEWRNYYTLDVPARGQFRYLAVEIGFGNSPVQQRDERSDG